MKKQIPRRTFLESSAAALGGVALFRLNGAAQTTPAAGKAQVFFTKDLSLDGLLKMYSKVNKGITGKVAIKLHTGEPHGPNLLPIEFSKGLQATVPGSTIVECNVLYPSPRQQTAGHRETLKTNGFDFCPVDIMDADGDVKLPIRRTGTHLSDLAVGKSLLKYDSLLVYTHFQGHTMGGFGGSLKNIAVGCASGGGGKVQIHGGGWERGPAFLERMVEGGKAVVDHFGTRITYLNVLKNISVDCDCDGRGAKPTCGDIGILASTDILAIDQASIDLVYKQPEKDRKDIVERITSRDGLHQLEWMKKLQMGNDQYDLIVV
jgi:uncharacterized protein